MANLLYDWGRDGFAQGVISWTADSIQLAFIDLALYVPDFVNDKFLSDIPLAAIVASTTTVPGRSTVAGTVRSTGATASWTGPSVEAIVAYKDTGLPATSRLIAYWDTAPGLPLPALTGQVVAVSWPVGPGNVFTL